MKKATEISTEAVDLSFISILAPFGGLTDCGSAAAAKSQFHVARCGDVFEFGFSSKELSRGEIVDGCFRLSESAEGAITPEAWLERLDRTHGLEYLINRYKIHIERSESDYCSESAVVLLPRRCLELAAWSRHNN